MPCLAWRHWAACLNVALTAQPAEEDDMNNLTDGRHCFVSALCQASVITTAAAVLNFGSAAVARDTRPHVNLTIHVYNYAEVPSQTLIQAENVAARIFRKAGVEIRWLGSPLDSA